jgi:hypothetical protein
MFWAMISKKGGNTPWATDLERNKSSASLYSAHWNSIVTPQNRQTDDKNSLTAGNGVSRGASSSGVWEATHLFTSGLPRRVTLNGVFYNTSCQGYHNTMINENDAC